MTPLAGRTAAGSTTAPGLKRAVVRLLLGSGEEPWVRPALLGVTLLAAALYLWNLTVSGYANTYYSAAALAGSQSWSALFFGSFDAANFITVDKPPLSLWLMGLSVRAFGLSSWSILLPEALVGVGTVVLLFHAVRRSFGPVAATIAGIVMAVYPVAVLMFRHNNPDALLTFLLVAGAWSLLRALEGGQVRWVALAAALVGLGFITKYLQAYLVLPAFALVYVVASAGSLRRRLGGLIFAGLTVLVTSGWWVAIVELIPAAARPYIGGSTNNSTLDLLFGFDGLGRIFGAPGGASGGPPGGGGGPLGGGGAGFGGATGILRLFNDEFAGQISWFIPFALVALVAGLWMRRHAPRTDRARAGYLLWGTWLVVNGLVFSFMSGIIHPYYTVVLAPAIGALVGAGLVELWALRSRTRWGGLVLAAALLATALWSWRLLEGTPGFVPGLGVGVLAVAIAAALVVAGPVTLRLGRAPIIAATLGLCALLAGPTAYALDTVASARSGGDPKAGPVASSDRGPFGMGPAGRATGGVPGGAAPAFPGSGPALPPGLPPGLQVQGAGAGAGIGDGVAGGQGVAVDSALVSYLLANKGGATWIVAANSTQGAGSIELATGEPVMAMGGFMGADPTPTLTQLKEYIASGRLRFVLAGGVGMGGALRTTGGGTGATASERNAWVTQACTAVDYGGSPGQAGFAPGGGTLYDCAGATRG